MDTITYQIGTSVYINLTNRCSNDCYFCERNRGAGVGGYMLWLQAEPTADEVIRSLAEYDEKDFDEVVFCGYGEPTYRWAQILSIAEYVHSVGKRTRINTNGQGSLINGYDITDELSSVIDSVSISLNNGSSRRYDEDCRSIYGEAAFFELQDFAKKCLQKGVDTTLSVVDCIPPEEIEQARGIAEALGAKFRVREESK